MERLNSDEAWRFIPPEEKVHIMTIAHAKGVMAVVLSLIISITCTIAMEIPWLLWSNILCAPLIFQFVSGKTWREIKPATTLRYLAARSAARKYAYAVNSDNITPKIILRGELELISEIRTEKEGTIQQEIDSNSTEVWIALFKESLVIISEQVGGARVELATQLDYHLAIKRPEEYKKSTGTYELLIELNKGNLLSTYKLSSPFPAAMTAFEQTYHMLYANVQKHEQTMQKMRSTKTLFNDFDELIKK